MTTETETKNHHRWAHLPAAPWKYTGAGREVYQAVPGDPNCPVQPGGCCDHCGTAIFECHYFTAKSGEHFKVGSTCVGKMLAQARADRESPASLQAAERAVKKARNAAAKLRNDAKAVAVKVELDALLADPKVCEALSSRPHPRDWAAAQGQTLLDCVSWMRENAGASGHRETLKLVRTALTPAQVVREA